MSLRAALVSCAPLSLLLTGCPLTDHYQLQESSLGNASAGSGDTLGGAGEDAGGAGSVAAAGGGSEPQATGGGCATTCNANRACVDNACESGWVATSKAPIVARSKAASVAMGKAVFIWGGVDDAGVALGNGAIYYPASDKWIPLPPDAGAPAARIMATAVWTGSASNKVVVFGGTDASGEIIYRDGAVYDLANNAWTALPIGSASRRSAPYGYWDGTRAIFYGGSTVGSAVVPGADRFDLSRWSTSTTSGDPGSLAFSATAVDGTVMYLQGGVISGTRQDKVFAYTSSTDTWAGLSKSISPRTGGFGAWDGSHFVVWGGQDDAGMLADGKMLSGSTWSDMTATELSPRRVGFRRSGWAFQVKPGVVAMIGGQTAAIGSRETLATDGATYTVSSGEWARIPSWPSEEAHEYGIGVWTGEEFVIWGGRSQNVSTLTGERWAP